MQWIKYLLLSMGAVFLIWAAWMLYGGPGETLARLVSAGAMAFSGLFVIGLYVFALRPVVKMDAQMTRLAAKGVRAQALVVSVKETSASINELPIMRVNVRYTINGKEHTGEVKQPILLHSLAAVRPGQRIPILVDPRQESLFVLSF